MGVHIQNEFEDRHQGLQLRVGRQLLDPVTQDSKPRQIMKSWWKKWKMRHGTRTSQFLVDKHLWEEG